jgi:single-strand DNA-binding protein
MNSDPESGGPRTFNRKDGTVGASYEVTALTVKFLGAREEGVSLETPREEEMPPEDEDSIPF